MVHSHLADRIKHEEKMVMTFLTAGLLTSGLLFASFLLLIVVAAGLVLLR
jgi:hypothetical protein